MNPLNEPSENPEGQEQFDVLCKLAASESLKENPHKLEFLWKLFLAFYEEYPDFGEFELGKEKAEVALLGAENGSLLDEEEIAERVFGSYLNGRFEIGLGERRPGYGHNFTFSIKESEYTAPYTNPVTFTISYDRSQEVFIIETIEDSTGKTVYGNIGWNPLYFAAKVLPQKLPFLTPLIPKTRDIPLNTEMRSAVMAKGEEIRRITDQLVATESDEEAAEVLAKHRAPKEVEERNTPKRQKQKLILPLNKS